MTRLRRAALLTAVAVLAAGCAQTVVAGPPDRVVGHGTVLDEGSGPELCISHLKTSNPPQCDGLPLKSWAWPDEGVERLSGTTWGGDYAVVGTWDGATLTVEKTVDPEVVTRTWDDKERDLSSPCPEPAGGWRALDPARATDATKERASLVAHALPTYAHSWVDDLGITEQTPTSIVLNVAVTEDLAGAEQKIRAVWGGALCVSKGIRPYADLLRVQSELNERPEMESSVPEPEHGWVHLGVIHDDGTLQRELDRTYGEGLVHVGSYLQPYAE